MHGSTGERTVKNAAYGFVSYLWPILFSFFLTPFIIHRLGVEEYGVYVLLLTIISFFSLLNFGFIYSFVKELSAANANTEASVARMRQIFGATLVIFTGVGVIAIATGVILMYAGPALFNLDAAQHSALQTSFFVVGIIGFLNSLSLVYSHIPFALQRQDIGTTVYIANITITGLLTIAALFLGRGVVWLIGIQVVSSALSLITLYWYSRKIAPWLTPVFTAPGSLYRQLAAAGGFMYMHNLSSTFLSQLDRLIISSMTGSAALTYYAVPGSLTEKIQGTVTSLSGILFPLTSQLLEQGRQEELRRIYRRAMTVILLLASALATSIAVFGHKILLYWVGPEIAVASTPILHWLVPTYFLLAVFMPLTNFLGGLGRTKFLALSSVSMATLNIVLLLVLLPTYGILGAAIAYFMSLLPLVGVIYYIEKYYFGLEGIGRFYLFLFGKLLATVALFCAVAIPVNMYGVSNLLTLVFVGPLFVVGFIGLYKVLGFFGTEDSELMGRVMRSFLRKLSILKA
jgi:O-antigen/teichoic acid export membrane protein